MTLDCRPAKHEQQITEYCVIIQIRSVIFAVILAQPSLDIYAMSSKGSIGGRYEDELAPKDRKSCGVRVSNYIFSGDVH